MLARFCILLVAPSHTGNAFFCAIALVGLVPVSATSEREPRFFLVSCCLAFALAVTHIFVNPNASQNGFIYILLVLNYNHINALSLASLSLVSGCLVCTGCCGVCKGFVGLFLAKFRMFSVFDVSAHIYLSSLDFVNKSLALSHLLSYSHFTSLMKDHSTSSYAFICTFIASCNCFLCVEVSFLPLHSFSRLFANLSNIDLAFSTLATSSDLATELGSIDLSIPTIHIRSVVALGLFNAVTADLTCDSAPHAFLIESYCSFIFFLNSLSAGVEYHNFFLASCNDSQSLCATLTRLSTICHLSDSVPHNHNVNHIACIFKSHH
jgi:hypothetical protein